MCIHAAISAISIYHTNLSSSSPILSSSAVLVTLSAATVILAASLVPELDVSLEENGVNGYRDVIAKAMQVLDGHRWEIEGAEGGKKELERFQRTVKEARVRKGRNGG